MAISLSIWVLGIIFLLFKSVKSINKFNKTQRKVLLFFILFWPIILISIITLFVALSFSRVKICG